MAVGVEIQVDERRLRRIEADLAAVPKAMPKVMSRAVNKTATSARTVIVRQVAAEMPLKQATLRKRVRLTRASWRRWRAVVRLTGKRIPLIQFGARQTRRRGVTYRIRKTDRRRLAASAFVATMPSGHRGVFRRRPGAQRLPIDELFGPSLQAAVDDIDQLARRTLGRKLDRDLGEEIDRQVGVVIQRRRRRAG